METLNYKVLESTGYNEMCIRDRCYTWSVIWSVTMTVRFHLFPFRTQ